jgi:hypothetical protein
VSITGVGMTNYTKLSNGCSVPSIESMNDIEWRLRYAQDTLKKEDLLHVAHMLSYFDALIWMTQKARNKQIEELKNG